MTPESDRTASRRVLVFRARMVIHGAAKTWILWPETRAVHRNDLDEALTDLIYEAAVLPEFWPTVLDRLAQIAGAQGGGADRRGSAVASLDQLPAPR